MCWGTVGTDATAGLGSHHTAQKGLLATRVTEGAASTHQQLGVLVHRILLPWREVKGREAHALTNPVAGVRVEEEGHAPHTCGQKGVSGVFAEKVALLGFRELPRAGTMHARLEGSENPSSNLSHLGVTSAVALVSKEP